MAIAKLFKFNFKTRKITSESGEEIGRTKKQPSVAVELPVPSPEETIGYLSNPDSKEAALVSEAVNAIIYQAAREQFDEIIDAFGDDDTKVVAASMLDFSRLDLSFIANLPPSARASSALTEEDFNAFFADYLPVMVQATGKEEHRIKLHIDLFKKPNKAKANKGVMHVLVEQLDIYLASSANLEEHATVATRIRDKFQRWIDEPEKALNLDLL